MSTTRKVALTPAIVRRHTDNRGASWDIGMLDIAQDHILCILHEEGFFGAGLVFKGGTALRKCRSGTRGRFSTDLDFAVTTSDVIGPVFDLIHGRECHGFRFDLDNQDLISGRADMRVYPPFLENGKSSSAPLRTSSKLEISPRNLWLNTENLAFVNSASHIALDHPIPSAPIVCVTEAVAEKLARYARQPIVRDLYDLCWYGRNTQLDENAIRSVWIKKVYLDFVVEGRWKSRKFDPQLIISDSVLGRLRAEQIGMYHDDSEVPKWDAEFRSRYAFLTQLSDGDRFWAQCNARDKFQFEQSVRDLGSHS